MKHTPHVFRDYRVTLRWSYQCEAWVAGVDKLTIIQSQGRDPNEALQRLERNFDQQKKASARLRVKFPGPEEQGA